MFNENAQVINRFISENRLISDIFEMTDILNMEGHILAVDIETVFDFVRLFTCYSGKIWLYE